MKFTETERIIFQEILTSEGWRLFLQILDYYYDNQTAAQLEARELPRIEAYRAKRDAVKDIKNLISQYSKQEGKK